eukprot:scaffold3476_cov112-Isochrysis_galbana.AAC.2
MSESAAARESSLKPHCVSGTPGTSAPASWPKTKPISRRPAGRSAIAAARHPTAIWHPRRYTRRSRAGRHRRSVAPSASINRTRLPRAAAAPAARAAPLPPLRPWPDEMSRSLGPPAEGSSEWPRSVGFVPRAFPEQWGIPPAQLRAAAAPFPSDSGIPPTPSSTRAGLPSQRPTRCLASVVCLCIRSAASLAASTMRRCTSSAVPSVEPSSMTTTSHGPDRVRVRAGMSTVREAVPGRRARGGGGGEAGEEAAGVRGRRRRGVPRGGGEDWESDAEYAPRVYEVPSAQPIGSPHRPPPPSPPTHRGGSGCRSRGARGEETAVAGPGEPRRTAAAAMAAAEEAGMRCRQKGRMSAGGQEFALCRKPRCTLDLWNARRGSS